MSALELSWRPRILVVDDAQENVRFAGRIVAPLADVSFALDGDGGLTRARDLRPDLVLLDVELPDMDGYEVIEAMREDPELAETPVIFLTGRYDDADEARGLDLGAADYVTKPFNAAVVLARVRNQLRLIDYARKLTALNAELERRATTDELTGLPNRRAFFDVARRELSRHQRFGEPCMALMLDIDHFKSVNDTHGHDIGDLVLRAVAERLRDSVRKSDCPARLGGEEFALLMPNTDVAGGEVVAERMAATVREAPVPTPAGPLRVTATLGLTAMSARDQSVEEMLKRADEALYDGKRAGRDRVVRRDPPPPPAVEAAE